MKIVYNQSKFMGSMLALVLAFSGFIAIKSPVEAQTSTIQTCPPDVSLNITSGMNVQNVMPINLGFTSNTLTTSSINRVIIKLDSTIIGQARQSTATANLWSMPWVTSLATPGSHTLSAVVTFNQTSQCTTVPVGINVLPSPTASNFDVLVNPLAWNGFTNTFADFQLSPVVSASISLYELSQTIVYEWDTNIGSLIPGQQVVRFSSGPNAGIGRMRFRAYYGGATIIKEIPVTVTSPVTTTTTTSPTTTPTSSPTPTTGTGTGSTTGSTSPTTSTTTNTTTPGTVPATSTTTNTTNTSVPKLTTTETINAQIESQPKIQDCATLNLSKQRMDDLRQSGTRLSPLEFSKVKGCFSESSYIIPAAYAPLEPTAVKEKVVETTETSINTASTELPSTAAPAGPVLRLKGKSAPNKDVLIYVFSEPMVLYTTSDGEGNWVYDLSNPMEPGDHKAYAVVESSDGTYKRSSPFAFLVGTAQASAENPKGYSLTIQKVGTLTPPASKRKISLYVWGSVMMLAVVAGLGGSLLYKTLKHVPSDDKESDEV